MSINDDINDLSYQLSRPVVSSVKPRWERKQMEEGRTPGKVVTNNSMNSISQVSKTPSKGKTPSKMYAGDRFIPNRDAMNPSVALHSVTNNENSQPDMDFSTSNSQQEFNCQLAQSLFQGDSINSKILTFKNKAPKPTEGFDKNLRVVYTQNKAAAPVKRVSRHISSAPERILDAPDLLDDYYLNLLDWSSANKLAIALGQCVYMWDPLTGGIELLLECKGEDQHVTGINWMQDGSHIAVGTSDNNVQLWDVNQKKQLRNMKGHSARVGALSWNQHILSSGSRDSNIINHDVRIAQHAISTFKSHEQEICGLKWSPDGTQLASGGNDNMMCVWDVNSATGSHGIVNTPKFKSQESCAAVKALAWCPWQKNVLATGSGTADRHIRFYNTASGACINKIDTGSQVCSLLWSTTERELLSSHGFSQNQLTIWKFPSLVKVAELTGHTSRVLHTSISPDGSTVCSAAADETLRFWKVWDTVEQKRQAKKDAVSTVGVPQNSGSSSSMMNMKIR